MTEYIAYKAHRKLLSIFFPNLVEHTHASSTQATSFIAIKAEGFEGISSTFDYQVSFLCNDDTYSINHFLGEEALLTISQTDCDDKVIHGVVENIRKSEQNTLQGNVTIITIKIVPRFALLKNSCDYRIYQKQSVVDIIKTVFKSCYGGIVDFSFLTKRYPDIHYCVQYNESSFDFISRLCEAHGIYYICETRLKTYDGAEKTKNFEHVIVFHDLGKPIKNYNNSPIRFQPRHYEDKGIFTWKENINLLAENWLLLSQAETTLSDLSPGMMFELVGLPLISENKNFLIKKFYCDVQDYSQQKYFKSTKKQPLVTQFKSHLILQSAKVRYRPDKKTENPFASCETAIVTGPEDEEIHTDALGRVKVFFPWDRYGTRDESSSCWIPVLQSISGETHGTNFIPRIGDEVLIDYELNQPDKPRVIGSLYNEENFPPFSPEETPYKTGIKTNTIYTTDPDEANILSFDDNEEMPEISIQAQRDYHTEVDGNFTQHINVDSEIIVEKGSYAQTNGGILKITATEEISFSCGSSMLSLTQSGITVQGANFVVNQSAVALPVLPQGDVIAGMVAALSDNGEENTEKTNSK